MSRGLRMGLVLLFALLLAPHKTAAQIVHTVDRGETLGKIARLYYGSASKAAYLAGVNQIPLDGKLKPGQKLKVAVVWSYRVRRGDRLPAIARKVLGDERRYPYLARFNDVEEMARLPTGSRVWVPIEVKHKVVRGETLTGLARRYYRNGRKASLLRDYNFLGRKKPVAGDQLIVPIFDKAARLADVKRRMATAAAKHEARPGPTRPAPRKAERSTREKARPTRASTPPTDTRTGPNPAPHPKSRPRSPALDAALRRGEKALARGAYADAVGGLEPLLATLADEDRARQHRLRLTLATALVALGRRGEATEHLQRLIEIDPETSLDPVTTSPKVMEAFQRAQEAWSAQLDDPGESR